MNNPVDIVKVIVPLGAYAFHAGDSLIYFLKKHSIGPEDMLLECVRLTCMYSGQIPREELDNLEWPGIDAGWESVADPVGRTPGQLDYWQFRKKALDAIYLMYTTLHPYLAYAFQRYISPGSLVQFGYAVPPRPMGTTDLLVHIGVFISPPNNTPASIV